MEQKISAFINSLATNPWLVIISFIISLLGIVLAIIFYFKSKRLKKPRLESKSINLLRESAEKIDGLKITYLSENIPNITITKLAIWNEGNETVNGSDIAQAHPLAIIAENDVKILEAKIIYTKNESNEINIQEIESGKKLNVTFDYLDFEDGAVIQILHTGNSSEDIKFEGTIKGVGKIGLDNHIKKRKSILASIEDKLGKKGKLKFLGITSIIMGIIIFIMGIITLIMGIRTIDISKSQINPMVSAILYTVLSIAYIIAGFKALKKRVPKGFEIFEENI